MIVGWHYLSDEDQGAPPSAATFLDVAGAGAGMRAAERMARVYEHKTRPDPAAYAATGLLWHAKGCRLQAANEPNLPSENFGGGPWGYARWFADVRSRALGARWYYAGMSPGVEGWQRWYGAGDPQLRAFIAAEADGIAAHAYGTFAQMREVVEVVLPIGKPIWLAEVNFGAGQHADRDAWARDHLRPFLDWSATKSLIEAVTYFAYRWPSPDMSLPTPVDGAGTEIERVLREWKPPVVVPQPIVKPTPKPQEPPMPQYQTAMIGGVEVLDVRDRFPEVQGRVYPRRPLSTIKRKVAHHSVTRVPMTIADALSVLDAIQSWHTSGYREYPGEAHDWPAIGYGFAIDGAGRRYWLNGLEVASYHARQANGDGVGIVWLGTFEHSAPPDVMVESFRELSGGLDRHVARVLALVGHREIPTNPTTCPGEHWQETKARLLRQEDDIVDKPKLVKALDDGWALTETLANKLEHPALAVKLQKELVKIKAATGVN